MQGGPSHGHKWMLATPHLVMANGEQGWGVWMVTCRVILEAIMHVRGVAHGNDNNFEDLGVMSPIQASKHVNSNNHHVQVSAFFGSIHA